MLRENGLLKKTNTPKGLTKADKDAQKSDNLIKAENRKGQNFTAEKPGEKCVTDITEWTGRDGKLYVSGIFDCFDNACLGLSIDVNMRAELVCDTLRIAVCNFPELTANNAIIHSDRGSQYTSEIYRNDIEKYRIRQSMNSAAGRCHDNAKCESMWARAKSEVMMCYDTRKLSCAELKKLLTSYFTDYWNNRRICSAIGGVPPMVKRGAYFERLLDSAA